MRQVTCLGNCDMMKEVSAHFSSISRITGHHVDDLPSHLAGILTPCHLQLALNMLRRVETVAAAAASKVSCTNNASLQGARWTCRCRLVSAQAVLYASFFSNVHAESQAIAATTLVACALSALPVCVLLLVSI